MAAIFSLIVTESGLVAANSAATASVSSEVPAEKAVYSTETTTSSISDPLKPAVSSASRSRS